MSEPNKYKVLNQAHQQEAEQKPQQAKSQAAALSNAASQGLPSATQQQEPKAENQQGRGNGGATPLSAQSQAPQQTADDAERQALKHKATTASRVSELHTQGDLVSSNQAANLQQALRQRDRTPSPSVPKQQDNSAKHGGHENQQPEQTPEKTKQAEKGDAVLEMTDKKQRTQGSDNARYRELMKQSQQANSAGRGQDRGGNSQGR